MNKKKQDGKGVHRIKQRGRVERALKSITHPVAFSVDKAVYCKLSCGVLGGS